MCGIFGYIGPAKRGKDKKNAAEIVLNGLKTLEYRGYDSWGVAAVSDQPLATRGQLGKITVEKHVGKIGKADLT